MSIFNKMFLEGRKSAVHPVNIICSFTLVSYEIYVYKSYLRNVKIRFYFGVIISQIIDYAVANISLKLSS